MSRTETAIGWAKTLGSLCLWAALLMPPFVFSLTAKDPFRLPKLLTTEVLVLTSLVFFSVQLLSAGSFPQGRSLLQRAGDLWRIPALRAVVPLLLVATLGLFTSSHPFHLREALWDLWIGAACLVGWSSALGAPKLRTFLNGLLWPAAGLSALGILQFHDLYRPLQFAAGEEVHRLGVTSLAGSVGDLAAYLVLPCLVAQVGLWLNLRRGSRQRLLFWGACLALCLYALAITQTLTALVALGGSSVVLWAIIVGRRRAALAGVLGLALVLFAGLTVGALRERAVNLVEELGRGNFNAVLTGRVDAWKAGGWMWRQHPWTGVGHGGFVAEFSPAKLALLEEGVEFYAGHGPNATFANAHNEMVEAVAELGVLGLLALGWTGWVVLQAARRLPPPGGSDKKTGAGDERRGTRALAWAGLVSFFLLSVGFFPFRVALVAYPALLFLAWLLRAPDAPIEPGEPTRSGKSRPKKRETVAVSGLRRLPLFLVVSVPLVLALVGQWERRRDRLQASRLLLQAQQISGLVQSGRGARQLLLANVQVLRRAQELDPSSVGIPLALGSQYFLLNRPTTALDWYHKALALEPRPEIYLNLGRTMLQTGQEEAKRNFERAVKLNPLLAAEVPPGQL